MISIFGPSHWATAKSTNYRTFRGVVLITRQIQAKFVVYPLNMPLPPHFDSKWPKIPPNSIVAMGMHQPSFVSQESFWICAAT